MKTGKEKSHDLYLACQEYIKWNGRNRFDSSIEIHKSKIKKAHELEKKYTIKRGGLVRILRLDEYHGKRTDTGTMAEGSRKQSHSNTDGRDYATG
jgi:hypothetical protein